MSRNMIGRRHDRNTRLWQVAGAVTALSMTGVAKASVDRSVVQRPAPLERECAATVDDAIDPVLSIPCGSARAPVDADAVAALIRAPQTDAGALRPTASWFGATAKPVCAASLDADHDAAMPAYCASVAQTVIGSRRSADRDETAASARHALGPGDPPDPPLAADAVQDVDLAMAAGAPSVGLAATDSTDGTDSSDLAAASVATEAAVPRATEVSNVRIDVGGAAGTVAEVVAEAAAASGLDTAAAAGAQTTTEARTIETGVAPGSSQIEVRVVAAEPRTIGTDVARIRAAKAQAAEARAAEVQATETRTGATSAVEAFGPSDVAVSAADASVAAEAYAIDAALAVEAISAATARLVGSPVESALVHGDAGQRIRPEPPDRALAWRSGPKASEPVAAPGSASPGCAVHADSEFDSAMPAYCTAPTQTVLAARSRNDAVDPSAQRLAGSDLAQRLAGSDSAPLDFPSCNAAQDDRLDSAMPAYCAAPAQVVIAARSPAASMPASTRLAEPGDSVAANPLSKAASVDATACGLLPDQTDQVDNAMPAACPTAQPLAQTEELPAAFGDAKLVAAAELAETRGGFEMSDGGQTLRVTFGIERAVYVNGNLVSTSTLALDGLNRLTGTGLGGTGANMRATSSTADVLSNGPGNIVSLGAAATPAGALVLQNTLDNQQLGARTVINAVVESSAAMRAARLESMMRDAAVGAVRR